MDAFGECSTPIRFLQGAFSRWLWASSPRARKFLRNLRGGFFVHDGKSLSARFEVADVSKGRAKPQQITLGASLNLPHIHDWKLNGSSSEKSNEKNVAPPLPGCHTTFSCCSCNRTERPGRRLQLVFALSCTEKKSQDGHLIECCDEDRQVCSVQKSATLARLLSQSGGFFVCRISGPNRCGCTTGTDSAPTAETAMARPAREAY